MTNQHPNSPANAAGPEPIPVPITPEREEPVRAPPLLRLPVNTRGRDWFVGDLHGEFLLLKEFFRQVSFDPTRDRLIAVGDLVDRGRQSQDLLELFGDSPDWFYSTLGNHDAMMRETILDWCWETERCWHRNGGEWATMLSAGERERLARIMLRMPLAIELELPDGRRIGVVHAELPCDAQWSEVVNARVGAAEAIECGGYLGSCLLWSRRRARWAAKARSSPKASEVPLVLRAAGLRELAPVAGLDLLLMGHTRTDPALPLHISNFLWIDTGGGYKGGRLSFVDLMAGEYVQLRHDHRRFRLRPLPPACSLEGWQLTPQQAQRAQVQEEEAQRLRRERLNKFPGWI